MCEDHSQEKYQQPCELPGKVSAQEAQSNRSKLLDIINQSFYSTPIKREFQNYLAKREKERKFYGDVED